MTAWGWGDKGRKAHWFPDDTDRARCGKAIKVEDAQGVPDKDKCAACRKAADVDTLAAARAEADNAPTPVRSLRVRVPPGGDACPSTVHADEQVRANWPGVMTGRLPTLVGDDATFCDWCAYLLARIGFFSPDTEPEPPACVRCQVAYAVPSHDPCCTAKHPHGRPLCCHCYGVTHHVQGVPCH